MNNAEPQPAVILDKKLKNIAMPKLEYGTKVIISMFKDCKTIATSKIFVRPNFCIKGWRMNEVNKDAVGQEL